MALNLALRGKKHRLAILLRKGHARSMTKKGVQEAIAAHTVSLGWSFRSTILYAYST